MDMPPIAVAIHQLSDTSSTLTYNLKRKEISRSFDFKGKQEHIIPKNQVFLMMKGIRPAYKIRN